MIGLIEITKRLCRNIQCKHIQRENIKAQFTDGNADASRCFFRGKLPGDFYSHVEFYRPQSPEDTKGYVLYLSRGSQGKPAPMIRMTDIDGDFEVDSVHIETMRDKNYCLVQDFKKDEKNHAPIISVAQTVYYTYLQKIADYKNECVLKALNSSARKNRTG